MTETQHTDESLTADHNNGANDTHHRLDRGGMLSVAAEDALEKGNYEEAESLLLQAIAAREEIFGHSNRKLVPLLNTLSNLYTDTSRFVEAEKSFNRALDILQANPKDSKAREIEVLGNFGRMLRMAGRNTEAEHVEACCEAVRHEEDQAPLLLKLARGLTPSTSIDVRDFGKWLDQTVVPPGSTIPKGQSGSVATSSPELPAKARGGLSPRWIVVGILLFAWVAWLAYFIFSK